MFGSTEDAEPAAEGDGPQNEHDKKDACNIKAHNELAKYKNRANTLLADGKSHCAKCADGGHVHDDADNLEQHFRKALDEVKAELALLAAVIQGKGKQHGHQQHLEDLAAGKGRNKGIGNDVEEEVDDIVVFGLASILGGNVFVRSVEGANVNIHAHSGLGQVDHHKADSKCRKRNDGKVHQRYTASFAHSLDIFHASYAGNNG